MKYPKDTTIPCPRGHRVWTFNGDGDPLTLDFIPEVTLNKSGSRVLGRLVGCTECEIQAIDKEIFALGKRMCFDLRADEVRVLSSVVESTPD